MKRFVNLLLGGALVMAFAASCEPTGTSNTEKPVLVATPESIDATGEDITTFTVLYGEEDVTAESRIFLAKDNSELINKNFSTTTPGDYEFYATYNNISSDFIKVIAKSGNAELTADVSTIYSYESSVVTFTLTQEGVDVTNESTLYLIPEGGEPIPQEGFTFSSTEPGIYNFYATKGTVSSNRISILVSEAEKPSNWDFRKRSLVLEFTATWCGPCSIMKAGIKSLEQEGWDDGYVAECHSGDGMAVNSILSPLATLAVGSLSFGIPMVTFNFADTPRKEGHGGSVPASAKLIRDLTDQANSDYPCTSGANVTFGEAGGNMKVTADIAITEAGEYKASCWLLENNIQENQNDLTGDPQWNLSNHINVLRAVSYIQDLTGEPMFSGANSTQRFEWEFQTSALKNKDTANAHVLVLITKQEENGDFIVNNVIRCDFGETTAFDYAE